MASSSADAQIAEAVKDALAAGTWSQEFTASRTYDLGMELSDDGLHVDVAVGENSGEVDTRGSTLNEYSVDIAIRQKCDVDNTTLDALMALVEEIKDALVAKRLSTESLGTAWCHAWEQKPSYYRSHLANFRQFTSLLTLKYRLTRSL